jgi:hypothetical protein
MERWFVKSYSACKFGNFLKVFFFFLRWKLIYTFKTSSPVYIRQKRRDLEQIATEGFLGSSW